jgi:hypothetical protein
MNFTKHVFLQIVKTAPFISMNPMVAMILDTPSKGVMDDFFRYTIIGSSLVLAPTRLISFPFASAKVYSTIEQLHCGAWYLGIVGTGLVHF